MNGSVITDTVTNMADKPQVIPYGSARDLPSFRAIEEQLEAFKLLDLVLTMDLDEDLKKLEAEHLRITDTVDRFYGLLGERNWVFSDDLTLAAIEDVIDTEDAGIAEKRLIDYYKTDDRIAFPLRRLSRFDAMRPRMEMLRKALTDYEAGRYYSTVLVLLSVMDGFVNDLETSVRKGLHARPAQDLAAWDSVAGHHLGLGHAHQSFVKSFRRTDTTEITDLFRNGIVHGNLVSFDNEIIATKAWNRLFAVADWAASRTRQVEPAEKIPSLEESVRQWDGVQDQMARLEQWQPHEYVPESNDEKPREVAQACADFLEKWHKNQWALVGTHFMELGGKRSSVGQLAVEAKALYETHHLSDWKILRVQHVAAAVAHTDIEIHVNGTTYRTELRWVRIDDVGSTRTEWEPGRWTLSLYGPTHFLKDDAIFEKMDAPDRPATS